MLQSIASGYEPDCRMILSEDSSMDAIQYLPVISLLFKSKILPSDGTLREI